MMPRLLLLAALSLSALCLSACTMEVGEPEELILLEEEAVAADEGLVAAEPELADAEPASERVQAATTGLVDGQAEAVDPVAAKTRW